MADKHDEIVNQFLAVTEASDEQAQFFLESCNWELDTALISFFESVDDAFKDALVNDDDDEEMSAPPGVPDPTPTPEVVGPAGLWPLRPSTSTQGRGEFPSKRAKGKEKGSGKKGSSSRGGITTLSDLNRHADSDSDSDGPQEYYTGGEKRLEPCPSLHQSGTLIRVPGFVSVLIIETDS